MKYNLNADLATVTNFEKVLPAKKSIIEPVTVISDDMNFNNSRLSDVLDKLEKHYHTRIFYEKNELSDMYFQESFGIRFPVCHSKSYWKHERYTNRGHIGWFVAHKFNSK